MDPPPLFSPKFFFTKMTQNGLKWILNITLKTVKFFYFLKASLKDSPESKNGLTYFGFDSYRFRAALDLGLSGVQRLVWKKQTGAIRQSVGLVIIDRQNNILSKAEVKDSLLSGRQCPGRTNWRRQIEIVNILWSWQFCRYSSQVFWP